MGSLAADLASKSAAMASLEFLINHVFLPPKTPQKDDTSIEEEQNLVSSLLQTTKEFSKKCSTAESRQLEPVIGMLQQLVKARPGLESSTKQDIMKKVIRDLKAGEHALFHIRAQNAGLLLTGQQNHILVEAFELLAPNKDVMSCQGRLIREFPDCAAEVDRTTVLDSSFLQEFVNVLCRLELQASPVARPTSRKSGRNFDEERDTDSPVLVTDMVIGTLSGLKNSRSIEPQRISKKSREQVNWDTALLPFHRSPTWVLLRVALRLVLDRNGFHAGHRSLYKALTTFYHGHLLDQAAQFGLGSDIRFAMGAKLVRRFMKLNPEEDLPWSRKLRDVITANHDQLQQRWRKVQKDRATVQPSRLDQLCFQADASLRLDGLNKHQSWIESRSGDTEGATGPGNTTQYSAFPPGTLPSISGAVGLEIFVLLDLESWIELHLSSWAKRRLKTIDNNPTQAEQDIRKLQDLINQYYNRANGAYKGNPAALSVMYLNIMDLWVALDSIAGKAVPLLLEYDPGFPPSLLHPLLLATPIQMVRLKVIEDYLSSRRKAAPGSYPFAFDSFGETQSFAVRYFDSSPEHQELLNRVQIAAEDTQVQKLQEYYDMSSKHDELVQLQASISHDDVWDDYEAKLVCRPGCNACSLRRQIARLKIDIFEWPLPENATNCQAIIFEIRVPEVVALWRDTTTDLFLRVFPDSENLKDGKSKRLWHAADHSGLLPFRPTTSRVQLASTTKPIEASHYHAKHISMISEGEICVRHPWFKYGYYDRSSGISSDNLFRTARVPADCSLAEHQPERHGCHLRSWTRTTGHTSNEVIAYQSECPPGMSLDEFRAFGHLRSDLRFQWANVLCQLAMPSLNWTKESTYFLVLQACLEAGPADTDGGFLREVHRDLSSDHFVRSMAAALTDALGRFCENWQNDIAVSLLANLATRVLSTTTSRSLLDSILGFLSQARDVTIRWTRRLLEKRASCNNGNDRKELGQRVLMTALTCLSTFDMKPDLLEDLLHSADDLGVFVEAAIIAGDQMPTTGRISTPILLMLSHRWRRIIHKSLELVKREVIEKQNPGFHAAVQRFWADYSPSDTQWSALPGDQGHILEGRMTRGSSEPTSITFNLLEGQLLVNGYPLSRLPGEYEVHRTYRQLFGTQVLEVMPSTRVGMRFSACREQQGWVVHFATIGSELVIQAVRRREADSVKEDSPPEICEFIPSWKLEGDVPSSFIQNYSHWLNLSTKTIEFRPVDQPWTTSSDNWALTQNNGHSFLSRGGCYLIDLHSPTAKAISALLNPIESARHVDMIFHPADHTLVLDLPRFSLSFTLVEGEANIKSKHYSGMCIDKCQNIGTLVGLQNKLVLVQEGVSKLCTPSRTVLVPRGQLSSRMVSDHVSASVDFSDEEHVKHDAFSIDSRLGQLVSSGSLFSKLRLCHLHAVTSHCLPDSLTERTGTEEALRILHSASVQSFQRLDAESHNLLCEIANISPQRVFYPEHLQDMEQVKWSGKLPVLSQHDAFRPSVETILDHARDCGLLHQSSGAGASLPEVATLEPSSSFLIQRAKIRNSTFRVSEFGAEEHDATFDRRYSGRHRGKEGNVSKSFTRARRVTRCVVTESQQLIDRPSLQQLRKDILEITGTSFPGHPEVDITFNLEHLQPHRTSLSGLWCGLHLVLTKEPNKYKIAFFLSALLHAKHANWDIVQALMALANVRKKFDLAIMPPKEASFNRHYYATSLRYFVEVFVKEHSYLLHRCPEANLPQQPNEPMKKTSQRRHGTWKVRSQQMVREFTSDLEVQWQTRWTVSKPSGQDYHLYMEVNAIMRKVREALDFARRTYRFEEYLDELITELGQIPLCSSQEPAPSIPRPQLPETVADICDVVTQTVGEKELLANLFDQLSRVCEQTPYQLGYIEELRSSSGSTPRTRDQLKQGVGSLESIFEKCLLKCRQTAEEIRSSIDKALSGHSTVDATCQGANLYPRISPVFLLQRLSRTFWGELPPDWQACLVHYGLSLAYVQRAERLVNASRRPDRQTELLKELQNMGCHGFDEGDPLTFPENLLLELEQGILIRPVQQSIAAKMRDPPEGKNALMQLNMGEGKSSVIVPIVATALADGKRLVRVVVAKPQSKQMMHTLIATLGGLINRRVFYLPISRAVKLTAAGVEAVKRILDTCKKEGGILLVQPEHLLSFKLMGLERSWEDNSSTMDIGRHIHKTYREFEGVSRDIVDESDENFSVKFELIYTMGTQQPVDMSPDRWTMIQELMDVVLEVASNLAFEGKRVKGLLFGEDKTSGRFPTIRVVEESAGERLIIAVALHVCRTGLGGFPIQHQSKQMRQAVLQYILHPDLDPEEVAAVENASGGFFSEATSKNALLLLRGLLATNVILFALGQKRFRVNYGLAPDRRPATMLAVPCRAKDSPAPRSEFSHPDVVIALTSLSHYYQGLSDGELRTCLETLNKSDQAEQEYSRWAGASPQLPSSLRHFSGVNLKDNALCKESVFLALRYSKPAIDFYLANVVFPKEMREFPHKLSASGWDLGKAKRHPLTGFSGTTDSKYVLPLSVTALDLPEQRHTNSAVLGCLLRDENTVLELGDNQDQLSALTVDMLLTAVTTSAQPMRVILDVGAQIIELSNQQVAEEWLKRISIQDADA